MYLDDAVQALLGQRRVVAEAVEVARQRVQHRVGGAAWHTARPRGPIDGAGWGSTTARMLGVSG